MCKQKTSPEITIQVDWIQPVITKLLAGLVVQNFYGV